jgi:hypothetical protein
MLRQIDPSKHSDHYCALPPAVQNIIQVASTWFTYVSFFTTNHCTINLFLHCYMFRLTISAIIRESTYIDICNVYCVSQRSVPLNKRLDGTQSKFRRFGEENNLLPLPGSEPRFFSLSTRGLVTMPTTPSRLTFLLWGCNRNNSRRHFSFASWSFYATR